MIRYSTTFVGPYVVAVRYALPTVVTVNRFLIGSTAVRIFGKGWFGFRTFSFWGRYIR